MSFILSKDAAIYYEEYGSGEPLILLPGLLGTLETHWRRFITDFSKHYHTIVVDLRGHGRTNNPSGSLRLRTFVEDLHALCDTLQIDRVRICGYSLGGYIGLLYGLQHPGRVLALIMHGTKFYWSEETVRAFAGELDPERIMANVPAWGGLLQQEHGSGSGTDGWKELLRAGSEFIRTMPVEGIPDDALHLAAFPVLVSLADEDELIPRHEAERLVQCLPDATLGIIENARHPMQTVPKQAFIDRSLSFLMPLSGNE
jgi:pimeloyl-ACP methyl ester carboxylesterase